MFDKWLEKHRFHINMGSYQTKDLAKHIGISPRTIQRWIKGKGKPSQYQQQLVGEYLNNYD